MRGGLRLTFIVVARVIAGVSLLIELLIALKKASSSAERSGYSILVISFITAAAAVTEAESNLPICKPFQ